MLAVEALTEITSKKRSKKIGLQPVRVAGLFAVRRFAFLVSAEDGLFRAFLRCLFMTHTGS
ncbi:hypothetical protein, partial [Phascolarctobacterium sp.]|uniref:hypothetical protein n=1 Tax=Phascolarctobacterium sp. TaxID=2049039 RepID=UPI0025D9823E